MSLISEDNSVDFLRRQIVLGGKNRWEFEVKNRGIVGSQKLLETNWRVGKSVMTNLTFNRTHLYFGVYDGPSKET